MKKIILGLAVVAMAAATSAFTNRTIKTENGFAEVQFFNTTGIPSNDANDYIYDPNGSCEDTELACSASWEHSGSLVPGVTHPDGAKLSPDEEGTYEPSM